MGLPLVQQVRREQLRSLESVTPQGEVSTENKPVILPAMQPVMSSPAEASPPEAPSVVQEAPVSEPTEEIVDWRVRAEESDKRWKTFHGIHKNLVHENESLKNELNDLRSIVNDLRSVSEKAKYQEQELLDQLTPEEDEIYKNSLPVIEKVANRKIRQTEERLLKRVEQLENMMSSTGKKFEDVGTTLFNKEVQKEIRDLDDIVSNPKWTDYLSQKAPYSRDTFATRLNAALNSKDVETTVEILKGFKNSQVTPNLNSMVSPSIKSTERVSTTGQHKPTLKGSVLKKAQTDFVKGRFSGDPEKMKWYREMSDQYKQAEREHRIDWNA